MKVVLKRKGYIPIRKLYIEIGGITFSLKGNESKEIELLPGENELILKMDWWRVKKKITITTEGKRICIKHRFSDIFYIVGVTVILILAVLSFFAIISSLYASVSLALFYLPQLFFALRKNGNYFYIVDNNSPSN